MVAVASTEVQRTVGVCRDMAEDSQATPEPVTLLYGDKASVGIVSAAGFARLQQHDRQVMATEELPEWLVNQIAASEMDPRFAYLDQAE